MRFKEFRHNSTEDYQLVQVTPNLIKRVKAMTRKIAWDIAEDLPKNPVAFGEMLKELLQRMDQIGGIEQKMTVCRAELRPLQDLETRVPSIGLHWSWDDSGAKVYHHDNAYDNHGKENLAAVIFVAEVALNAIDWIYTLATNLIHPAEREITIKNNSVVHLEEMFVEGDYVKCGYNVDVSGYYQPD